VLVAQVAAEQEVQTQGQRRKVQALKVEIQFLLQPQQLVVDLADVAQVEIQAAQAAHQAAQVAVVDQLLLLRQRHKDQAVD
jgi:hypothetical protein